MGGATAGALRAAAARARRRLIARFRDGGAVSPSSPMAYIPERGVERRLIEQLLKKGVLHQTRPDVYWLNEPELSLWSRTRRRRAGAFAGTAVALGAAIGFLASGG